MKLGEKCVKENTTGFWPVLSWWDT